MDNMTKKTKVLFVITKSNWGGAQKYVFDLATGLPKDEFDIAVALGGNGVLIKKLNLAGIRTISIPYLERDINPLKEVASFFSILKIFIREAPDVVHLNSAKAGGVGALASRLAGVPKIIFTAHGWAFNEERPDWQKIIFKFFSWITVVLSHKTIAVSNAIKNDTESWPSVSEKIVVIKNGILKYEFYQAKEARMHLFAKANIHVPENAFVVGTIAELHKNKGLSYAIEAFAELCLKHQNLYYFILSGGEEMERLEALVGQRGLQGRVFLLGFVDDAYRYLKGFDLFLLPSITEALGLVLLEAGQAGLPVVATNVGGIPEIITDKETGLLVPSRDGESIALAVKTLIDSPELCSNLGTSLQNKVARDFSLARVISETSALYTTTR